MKPRALQRQKMAKGGKRSISMARCITSASLSGCKRQLQLQRPAPVNAGQVRANRELALFSPIWNKAREGGYIDKTNPCTGIKKHQAPGRNIYVDDATYQVVWQLAKEP